MIYNVKIEHLSPIASQNFNHSEHTAYDQQKNRNYIPRYLRRPVATVRRVPAVGRRGGRAAPAAPRAGLPPLLPARAMRVRRMMIAEKPTVSPSNIVYTAQFIR